MNRSQALASTAVFSLATFAVWYWSYATTRPVLAQDKVSNNATAFEKTIRPLLRDYCVTCHSTEKQKGELDLEPFSNVASIKKQT